MSDYRIIGNRVYKLVGECDSEKCDAWCCRFIVLKIPKVNMDDAGYFTAHGAEVRELNGQELVLKIPAKCNHLSSSLKCSIYEQRFVNCRKYAKRQGDWFSSPDCTIHWKEVGGREAQVAMKRFREG